MVIRSSTYPRFFYFHMHLASILMNTCLQFLAPFYCFQPDLFSDQIPPSFYRQNRHTDNTCHKDKSVASWKNHWNSQRLKNSYQTQTTHQPVFEGQDHRSTHSTIRSHGWPITFVKDHSKQYIMIKIIEKTN